MINLNNINGLFQNNHTGYIFGTMPFSFEERRLFMAPPETFKATELRINEDDNDNWTITDKEIKDLDPVDLKSLDKKDDEKKTPGNAEVITKEDIQEYHKLFDKEANKIISQFWITMNPPIGMDWLKTLSPSVHAKMLEFKTKMEGYTANIEAGEKTTALITMMQDSIQNIEDEVDDKMEALWWKPNNLTQAEIKHALLMDEAVDQKSEAEQTLDDSVDAACKDNMIAWLLWPDMIKSVIKQWGIIWKIAEIFLWLDLPKWTLEAFSSQDDKFAEILKDDTTWKLKALYEWNEENDPKWLFTEISKTILTDVKWENNSWNTPPDNPALADLKSATKWITNWNKGFWLILRDVAGRFWDNFNKDWTPPEPNRNHLASKGHSFGAPENAWDTVAVWKAQEELTINCRSSFHAAALARFYSPNMIKGWSWAFGFKNIKDIKNMFKSKEWKDKDEKSTTNKIIEKVKSNDPYSTQKDWLPSVIATVEWSKVKFVKATDFIEAIKGQIWMENDDEKKNSNNS